MTMTLQPNKTISLFDTYSLVIPPKLRYHTDGLPGHRVLFITDAKETFNVSFEEGMQMRDMLSLSNDSANAVSHQCCKGGCECENGFLHDL